MREGADELALSDQEIDPRRLLTARARTLECALACPIVAGDLDEGAFVPADLDRSARILDRLFAHVVTGAVVDLLIRAFVDADREHEAATGCKPAAASR